MANLPRITIRQPQPYDIVNDPVGVCGIGTGFEGSCVARIRDSNGVALITHPIQVGGMGIWSNFYVEVPCAAPPSPQGIIEVFDISARDGSEIHKVVVPIVFGNVLVNPYHGFAQHIVEERDTLLSIAQKYYGDITHWQRILEANRHKISDPNIICPGQVLHIPQ